MNKIPTAEEFLKQNNVVGMTELMVPIMKEFAKLHVEAALKAAAKKPDMNKELELEAEKYAEDEIKDRGAKNDKLICKIDFMAGATSKYVEKQKLEFAIEQLKECQKQYSLPELFYNKIKELQLINSK